MTVGRYTCRICQKRKSSTNSQDVLCRCVEVCQTCPLMALFGTHSTVVVGSNRLQLREAGGRLQPPQIFTSQCSAPPGMADSAGGRGERAWFFTNSPSGAGSKKPFFSHTLRQTPAPLARPVRQWTVRAGNQPIRLTTRPQHADVCLWHALRGTPARISSKHQRAARPRPPSSQACTCNTPQRPPGGGKVAKEGRQPPPIPETPHLTQPTLLTAKPFFSRWDTSCRVCSPLSAGSPAISLPTWVRPFRPPII